MDQHPSSIAVIFGPSRSKLFPKAVAFARAVATEIAEPEPGRYRAVFALGADPDAYTNASALIERVRHWQGSEFYLGGVSVSPPSSRTWGGVPAISSAATAPAGTGSSWASPSAVPPARCMRRIGPSERCGEKGRPHLSVLRSSSARTFGPSSGARFRQVSMPDPTRSRSRTSCRRSGKSCRARTPGLNI